MIFLVGTNETKARIILRRRGSFGRIKKAQIFTRDLSAEEGRDYFTADNDLGLLSFGPTEVYKEIKIRIAHQRTILTRKFKVELGNNEGTGRTSCKSNCQWLKSGPFLWFFVIS